MEDCIFCKIVAGEAPATVVYEDADTLVIETIEPVSKGHALAIPKVHSVNILDTEDGVLSRLIVAAKKAGAQIVRRHGAQALNVLHAAGKDAQQSVFHTHFHLVPRYENDGLDLWFRNNL